MAILNRFFFYAIMNVVIYFMTNDCYLPNFEQSLLFGADRFIFHADGLFFMHKKIPNRQTKRIGIPFVCLARKVLHRYDNKKRWAFQPIPCKIICEKQLTVIIV